MATNVQLTGNITIALDASKLTALGQFTTADGFSQSESVDLSSLITASAKQSVQQLIGLLEQQYQLLRQNLLPQSKCFLNDLSFLSPVLEATVSADTATAFAGAQSARITTTGNTLGEGVSLALGSVPKASVVTVIALVLLPQGVQVQGVLTDTTNTTDNYTVVSPPTTPASYNKQSAPITSTSAVIVGGASPAWQAIAVSLTLGTDAAPVLVLEIVSTEKVSSQFWLGAIQITRV